MRQTKGSIGIALVAAFVLALQSALAVAAAPVQRDIFGNPICADGSGGQSPGGGHDGEHLPDCCLLLCASASPTAADAPAPMVWPPIVRADRTIAPATSQVAARQNRRTPANPRAPPAAA